ncbi:MAG: ankyrin repeat domain-containing protein [Gallionella sp.]
MDKKILDLLNGDESKYPHELERQFARVFNRITLLWDTPEIEDYFFELLVDNRGGTRQGFPHTVASEIMVLQKLYTSRHERAEPAADVWESVPESKREALEQLGYEYSFKHFLKAIEAGDEAAVKIFLSCGADMESRDERDWTPLMMAASNGDEAMVLLLLRCGARVQAEDRNGYTPLHWCAFNGHTHIIEILLDNGARVNARSQFGWTALMQAATRGHAKTVTQLLAHGAEVNAVTTDGWTSLHKASANGHTEVVLILLEKGADISITYPDGSTALSLAIKNKHDQIVRVLTRFQKKYNQSGV